MACVTCGARRPRAPAGDERSFVLINAFVTRLAPYRADIEVAIERHAPADSDERGARTGRPAAVRTRPGHDRPPHRRYGREATLRVRARARRALHSARPPDSVLSDVRPADVELSRHDGDDSRVSMSDAPTLPSLADSYVSAGQLPEARIKRAVKKTRGRAAASGRSTGRSAPPQPDAPQPAACVPRGAARAWRGRAGSRRARDRLARSSSAVLALLPGRNDRRV